jgi:hypothetical protein
LFLDGRSSLLHLLPRVFGRVLRGVGGLISRILYLVSRTIDLDEALTALAAVDQRKSRVVEMRYFGGLSLEETAEALGVSHDTMRRD